MCCRHVCVREREIDVTKGRKGKADSKWMNGLVAHIQKSTNVVVGEGGREMLRGNAGEGRGGEGGSEKFSKKRINVFH